MNRYLQYKKILQSNSFPLSYIDMDLLDVNIKRVVERAGNKKIRIATKSVRSLEVLKYLEKNLGEKFNGYMCYSCQEALWLSSQGLDNLLVAYPSVDSESIRKISSLVSEGKKIYLMADSLEHIEFLKGFESRLLICIDIDLSTYLPGLNFGVYRSSLRDIESVERLVSEIKNIPSLELRSIMGYEAQIAGVTDNQKGRPFMNFVIGLLKKLSLSGISRKRQKVVELVKRKGVELDFVNGGGTGSMETTREEDVVTEIAVGSGFYCPTLFDFYKKFHHEPAAGFALNVVRIPETGTFTCFAGGYVASGALGGDKLSRPYLPQGCHLNSNEMAGEVQTPVHYSGDEQISLGSPIFFRHAKAGELFERFNEIHLLRGGLLENKIKTYRGEGKTFG